MKFIPLQKQSAFSGSPADDDFVIPFSGPSLMLREENGKFFPLTGKECGRLLSPDFPALPVGLLGDRLCFGLRLAALPEKGPGTILPGRTLLASGENALRTAYCRAKEMISWKENHRFCGHCGIRLIPSENDLAMLCPECRIPYYPQIAPAVIVAVTRNEGKEILLGHNSRFADGVFSILAGFVEAGESAEEAIVREIREEAGIEVRNIRYFSSQSWPFPNSLMLGFFAEYASGEVRADGIELTECRWFSRDSLPQIPKAGSIARTLIDLFVRGEK